MNVPDPRSMLIIYIDVTTNIASVSNLISLHPPTDSNGRTVPNI